MRTEIDAVAIGEKLRKLRGDRTQAEVARDVGVAVTTISSYETGERVPSDSMKCALAAYFGTTVGELFYFFAQNSTE